MNVVKVFLKIPLFQAPQQFSSAEKHQPTLEQSVSAVPPAVYAVIDFARGLHFVDCAKNHFFFNIRISYH